MSALAAAFDRDQIIAELEAVAMQLPPLYLAGEIFDGDFGCAPPMVRIAMMADGEIVLTDDHRAWPCQLMLFAPAIESLLPAALQLNFSGLSRDDRRRISENLDVFGELVFKAASGYPLQLSRRDVGRLARRASAMLVAGIRKNLTRYYERYDWSFDMSRRLKLARLARYWTPEDVTAIDVERARYRLHQRYEKWFLPVRRSVDVFVFDFERFRSDRESGRDAVNLRETEDELGRMSRELAAGEVY
jgi:hypothetical protein